MSPTDGEREEEHRSLVGLHRPQGLVGGHKHNLVIFGLEPRAVRADSVCTYIK